MYIRLASLGTLLVGLVGTVVNAQPYQGVFIQSNEEDNEVAAYILDDDGKLEFVEAYSTGGIGYPRQTLANTENGMGYTSANHAAYHIYGGAQWYVAGNMGGSDFEASLSIFKVNPDLTMELTDNVDCLRSDTDDYWANSVTSFEDRTCVFGGGTNNLLECFRISDEGKLTPDYSYDFNLTIPIRNTDAGHSGTASLQFSPDGTKLVALSKGSVDRLFPFNPIGPEGVPEVLGEAGLYSFPVLSEGEASYGDPTILEIDVNTRPYDFVWNHPSSDTIWTIGLPSGLVSDFSTQGANGIAVSVSDDNELTVIDDHQLGFLAACWIEYYAGYVYTSNFNTNNDISIIPTQDDNSLDVELRNITLANNRTIFVNDEDTQPIPPAEEGEDSGPVDLEISGNKLDGSIYMIVQAHFANQAVSLKINDDGSLTEVDRVKVRDPEPEWFWFSSVTTTTADEQELIDLYADGPTMAPATPTSAPETPTMAPATPYQGVFIQSNEEDNEVAAYILDDDGKLEFVEAYSTGGIGYPRQTLANTENGMGYTSANHAAYHIYGGAQWYVAGNMGGSDFEASLSIFKVNPDLTMELTDNVDCLRSDTDDYWANSVTSFEDRTCVFGGGTNNLLECFRISDEGKLTPDYSYDFNLTIPIRNTDAGHSGTASLQFSPDGTKLVALSKGSVDRLFPFNPIGPEGVPEVLGEAGLYSFPVLSEGEASYGDPTILEIDVNTRPYDFVWNHPSSDTIWTIGLPSGLVSDFSTQGANGIAVSVSDDNELTVIDDHQLGFLAACWIEYYAGYVYTSNFNTNNDISIIPTQDDNSLDVELRNITLANNRTIFVNDEDTQPIPPAEEGEDSGPVDLEISGNKLDGSIYMIVQAHFANQAVSLKINDDGSLTEVDRVKVRDPEPEWFWFSSVTTTTADEQELIDLYADGPTMAPGMPTMAPETPTTMAPATPTTAPETPTTAPMPTDPTSGGALHTVGTVMLALAFAIAAM